MPNGAAARARSYDWVSNEMFDAKLEEILGKMGAGAVLQIPGVYEAVSEHLNNAVLMALEAEREPPC